MSDSRLREALEQVIARAKTKTPCASHYQCLLGLLAAPASPEPAVEALSKPENVKWLLDASNQVISELGKQEHLDSDTFRWLCNAVGQVERDLKRAALAAKGAQISVAPRAKQEHNPPQEGA